MNSIQTLDLIEQQKRGVLNAVRRVQCAKSLIDIHRERHTPIPGWARPLVRNELNKLNYWLEHQAKNIVDRQLKMIDQTPNHEKHHLIERLRSREWCYLKGSFPLLARKVNDHCSIIDSSNTNQKALTQALNAVSKKAAGMVSELAPKDSQGEVDTTTVDPRLEITLDKSDLSSRKKTQRPKND